MTDPSKGASAFGADEVRRNGQLIPPTNTGIEQGAATDSRRRGQGADTKVHSN